MIVTARTIPSDRLTKQIYIDGEPTKWHAQKDAIWAKCYYRWHVYFNGWGGLHACCADTLPQAIENVRRREERE